MPRGIPWPTEEERLGHRLAQARAYKKRNAKAIRASRAEYYSKNKASEAVNNKKWVERNPDKVRASRARDRKKNGSARQKKPERKAKRNEHARRVYASDTNYRIEKCLRASLFQALKKTRVPKRESVLKFLGCTIDEFRAHIAVQFKDGMAWDNHGKWHLDHIRPVASFDLSDIQQQAACFHHSNFQPLWGPENQRKRATWTPT